jgi:hypothetical protein
VGEVDVKQPPGGRAAALISTPPRRCS